MKFSKLNSPYLYAVSAFVFSALMGACVKSLGGAVPLSLILTARFWVGLGMVYPLARRERGYYYALRTKKIKMHLLRAVSGMATVGLFFMALPRLPLGDANALGQIYPFFLLALSGPLLGEVIKPKQYLACILGFAGVVLIAQPHGTSGLIPALMVVASSLTAAVTDLLVRGLARTEKSLTTVLWFFLLAGTISFIWWFVADRHVQITYTQALLLVLVGLTGGLTQFALTESFKHLPAGIMGAFSYLGLFFSALFGFIFFHEVPSLWMLSGIALIVTGARWSYILHRK